MKKYVYASVLLVVSAVTRAAVAADLALGAPVAMPPPLVPVWNWTGGYFGGHIGATWGETNVSDPFGSSLYGDDVHTPGFLGGIQTGYNWQAPNTPLVFGVEADLSGLSAIGTNTCLAYSGYFLSANCRSRPDASTTLTARIGAAVDPAQRTLFYVKGGLAGVHDNIDIATNAILDAAFSTTSSYWNWGWTAGAGVERALTPAWSLRLEYDYLGFGGHSVVTPASYLQVIPGDPFGYAATAANTARVSQNVQEVKFGLNYRINTDPAATWGADAVPVPAGRSAFAPAAFAWVAGWQFEGGVRYWMSSSKFQKDLGAGTTSAAMANVLNSRLTYNTAANSGELYGRVEAPENLFIKGMIGGGKISSGHMNDEDWLIFGEAVPYSNTSSSPVQGKLAYATVDVGYDVLRGPGYKLGAFAGYNYYRDDKDAYGCVQIANQLSDCVPAIPSSTLGITEDDTWNSLRVGVNGEMILLPGVKLATDVAYLPIAQYKGQDIHWLRTDVTDQTSPQAGTGSGVQLDAILSYSITPALSVGVGGRYWAMWTSNNAFTNIFGTQCPCQTEPVKTERYGLLLQADYKFDVPDATGENF